METPDEDVEVQWAIFRKYEREVPHRRLRDEDAAWDWYASWCRDGGDPEAFWVAKREVRRTEWRKAS